MEAHQGRTSRWLRVPAALVMGVAAGGADSARGQHVLDRNPQIGSGGINPARPDFAQEVRFRNAIVTGNVPGGLSLRVDVGYRAPGEFFERLGSNDLFAFQRDSVLSGLGGLGIRGTDALQYQFSAVTGGAPPPAVAGTLVFGRAGTGATPESLRVSGQRADPARADPWRPAISGTMGGTGLIPVMRSPAAYLTTRDMQPTIALVGQAPGGRERALTISSLRGIALSDVMPNPPPFEPWRPERVVPGRDDDPALRRPSPPAESASVPDLRVVPAVPAPEGEAGAGSGDRSRPGVTPAPAGADLRVRTAYEEIVERIRQAPGADRAERPQGETSSPEQAWETRLAELRSALRDRPARERTSTAAPEAGNVGPTPAQPAPEPAVQGPRRPAGERDGARERAAARVATWDEALVRMLRAAGVQPVERLAPPGFDLYAVSMQAGQEHMAAGRYFDAEERFTAALSARRNDPMAQAGRVHAQLGAGLYQSAAVNLRTLLTRHPELMAARYAPALLPLPDRLAVILEHLRQAAGADHPGARDAGLLLAYVGYQTGDRSAVAAGLEAVLKPRLDPSQQQADTLHRLGEMLRLLWETTSDGDSFDHAPAGEPPTGDHPDRENGSGANPGERERPG